MARKKEKKSKKIRFVLTIGDEGAILICMDGKKLLRRFFITSPSSPDFTNFLSSYPEAPLYVLVDLVEQASIQQTLPPVSSFNVKKLIARKLDKDFDATDLKAAIPIGREKGRKKEWNYLFVSVRNIPPFSDWIEVASNLPNYFAGIYLLPIEGMHFLKDLKKVHAKILKEENDDSKERFTHDAKWQIVVLHNRVGGFRQIIFKNDRVIFTRMAQPIGGQTPDVIAGNIEQETLNTIEYIRRLGFEDDMGVDIFVITSSSVKEALNSVPKTSKSPIIFTPYELATALGMESTAEEKDRFGDVVFASHFVNSKKHIMPLFTDYIKKVNGLIGMRKIIKNATILSIIGSLGFSGYLVYSTFELQDDVTQAESVKLRQQNLLTQKRNEDNGFNADPDMVKSMAEIDAKLSKDIELPLNFLSNLFVKQDFQAYVKEIDLQVTEKDKGSDLVESNFNYRFFRPDIAQRTQDNDNFKRTIETLFPAQDCGEQCYDVSWDGLLSFSDIQLAIGTEDEEKELQLNNLFTDIDLSIDGPTKQNFNNNRLRKRR